MIKSITIFLFLCSCVAIDANCQKKERYFKIEAGYLNGVGKIKFDQVLFVNNGHTRRLRFAYGLFFNSLTTLGVGVGLDRFEDPGHNTLPVFLEVDRRLQDGDRSLFGFLNVGSAVKLGPEFTKGFRFESGLGYLIKRRKTSLLPSIGINVQNIADGKAIIIDPVNRQVQFIETRITITSLSFNLGIQF